MSKFVVLALLLLLNLVSSQSNLCIVQDPATLKCTQCDPAFQLDDQGNCKLYTPIEGCQVYNSAPSGGCFSCAPTYLLNNAVCLAMLTNCQSTTNVNTCDQCIPGYQLIRFSACLSTAINNCQPGSLPRTVNGVSYCE